MPNFFSRAWADCAGQAWAGCGSHAYRAWEERESAQKRESEEEAGRRACGIFPGGTTAGEVIIVLEGRRKERERSELVDG